MTKKRRKSNEYHKSIFDYLTNNEKSIKFYKFYDSLKDGIVVDKK